MILAVCRRVLGDFHDAEDAFQATFLVLARKGASLVVGQSLGCWLYRVAYYTALRASAAIRIRARPQMASQLNPIEALRYEERSLAIPHKPDAPAKVHSNPSLARQACVTGIRAGEANNLRGSR